MTPEECQEVTKFGLGLTDVAKTTFGADRVLSDHYFDRNKLRAKIRKFAPKVLAFTSKRAAEEFVRHSVAYGLLTEAVGSTALFVLPSPSGMARRWWSIDPWRELANL